MVRRSSLRMMVSITAESGVASSKHHRVTTINYYAGIDVSLEDSCICVIDANGQGSSGRQGFERTNGADRLVDRGWRNLDAHRSGGWAAIAMALCGDAAGWARGGAFGDAARAQRVQDHAGQDRPQGCTWDCRTDAAGLVPAGALQVDGGPGDARHADRAQTGAEGASGN